MIALALRSHDPERYRNDFIAILLSHGIGMGMVLRGELFTGTQSSGGEFGHMIHRPGGALCRCGRRGCIEAYAGNYAIWRNAQGMPEDSPPVADISDADIAALADRARRDDGPEREAFRKAGEALGFGLGSLFALIDPAPVAMVGHGALAFDLLEPSIRAGDRHDRRRPAQQGHLVRHRAQRNAAHPRRLRRAGADLPRPADLCAGHQCHELWRQERTSPERPASGRPSCSQRCQLALLRRPQLAPACHAPVCRNCCCRRLANRRWCRPARSRAPRLAVLSPSPKCHQPYWPLAWPPPTVISRRITVDPHLTSSQAPIASTVRGGLLQLDLDPAAGVLAGVAPQLCAFPTVHDDQIQQAVQIEIRQSRAAGRGETGDACRLARFLELAVAGLQQQIVGVLHRKVRHLRDIALGDEQIHQAVIVDVFELRVPGRAGVPIAARVGAMRGDALGEGHVVECRLGRSVLRDGRTGSAACCRPCW